MQAVFKGLKQRLEANQNSAEQSTEIDGLRILNVIDEE